ncbi:primosomal protein N', partial [gut metagenome]
MKEVVELLDKTPLLLPVQLTFWEWLADYYLCTLGDVYKAALPSGLKLESETIVVFNPDFEATESLSDRELHLLDLLSDEPQQCITKLEKTSGYKNLLPVVKDLLERGAVWVKEEM